MTQVASYTDRIGATTFVDFPTLPDIIDINDLVPPLDFMRGVDNRMTNDMLRMMDRTSLKSMLALIGKLKSMVGVNNAAPVIFGWTLLELAAAAVLAEKSYDLYEWTIEEDPDPEPNNDDKGGKITAESEWPMGYALYDLVRRIQYNWLLANQMRW
ncbi:MAG: hypothetical protein P8J18_08395 [Halieaceae bacterium]|nr:hypothetical protein [Halieaceae bacterium]